MSLSKAAQINMLHHSVLSCRSQLGELIEVLYDEGVSPKVLVLACQKLLQAYLKSFEIPPELLDAFVLPTADDVRICGESACSAHWAVLAVSGGVLGLVAVIVCSPPHEASRVSFDGSALKGFVARINGGFIARINGIMQSRMEARIEGLLGDWRKEQKRKRDPRADKAIDGLVRIGRDHGLEETVRAIGDVMVAECPEVLSLTKQMLYRFFYGCLDEVFPQMEDAHIPVLREQLCFIRSHELSDVKPRLRRELLFARENLGARADSKTDSLKKRGAVVPENPDVVKLAKKIKQDLPKGGTKMDIARGFTNGDEKRAQSLLRQLRGGRFKHLLE